MRFLAVTGLLWGMISSILVGRCFPQETSRNSENFSEVAIKVYADCEDCDRDHLRREIAFVNFVRDRKQADVHILASKQRTGGGGWKYTAEFIGRGDFEDMRDTLIFVSRQSDTDDKIRAGLTRLIKIGLVRYVARTPLAKHLSVGFTLPTKPAAVVDKWNYWVFEVELDSWFNGERASRHLNFFGDLSANRVTEQTKVGLSVWGNYQESKFEYEDIKTTSISRGRGASAGMALGLGDHWSVGAEASVSSSTYSNKKIGLRASPGIEYNFFPYSESTRRQLRVIYLVSAGYVRYYEETIFDKYSEWLQSQSLSISLELIQPWGSVNTTLEGSHYFHDFHKNRLELYTQLSVRLFEGFSFEISSAVSRIRDQLSLPKAGATEEEIYLRRKELATNYQYWGSFGISYTFGSIYSNIVNPRFGG